MASEHRIVHACFPLDESRLGVALTDPRSAPGLSAAKLTLDFGATVSAACGRSTTGSTTVPLTIDTLLGDGEHSGWLSSTGSSTQPS